MQYYIDIKLLSDTEITLGFIWQKVYNDIHLALVEHKDHENMVSIGLSLPAYGEIFPLGNVLRLFAQSEAELKSLNLDTRLIRYADYVDIGDTKEIPPEIKGYVTFGRKQFKSNPQRLAKRYAKRHSVSLEEALEVYKQVEAQQTKLPYINIKSTSTGQHLKIFIEKKEAKREEKGKFTTFGLSQTATVPWF